VLELRVLKHTWEENDMTKKRTKKKRIGLENILSDG
jgi:hypothetical protein